MPLLLVSLLVLVWQFAAVRKLHSVLVLCVVFFLVSLKVLVC